MKIKKRMGKVEQWAEKQGLELAADCHLARVVQAAHLLQARKNTAEDIASVSSICFKLNSVQLRTLLDLYEPSPDERPISREMIGKSNIPVPEGQDNLLCSSHICKFALKWIDLFIPIELIKNKLHGLSPPGGFESPLGGFASLLFNQAVPKNPSAI